MATTINAGTATSGAAISADTTGILQLQSGSTPTTAVTVNTSQNVGIGTTSPTQKLQVAGYGFFSGANNGTILGESNCLIVGDSATTNAANMVFYTANTERMRIDTGGNVLFGKTELGTTNPGSYFENAVSNGYARLNFVKGPASGTGSTPALAFYYNGSGIGQVSCTNTATAYVTSSDYRLKEDIAPMQSALATVSLLKPVTYKWKSDGSSGQGFIAHELAEVVPEAVSGEKDAVDAEGKPIYQGIDTSFLVATLTAAIQELNAKVDAQAAEIQALKGTK